jgi:hypothetical protein
MSSAAGTASAASSWSHRSSDRLAARTLSMAGIAITSSSGPSVATAAQLKALAWRSWWLIWPSSRIHRLALTAASSGPQPGWHQTPSANCRTKSSKS